MNHRSSGQGRAIEAHQRRQGDNEFEELLEIELDGGDGVEAGEHHAGSHGLVLLVVEAPAVLLDGRVLRVTTRREVDELPEVETVVARSFTNEEALGWRQPATVERHRQPPHADVGTLEASVVGPHFQRSYSGTLAEIHEDA